jgi:hypothetical protein
MQALVNYLTGLRRIDLDFFQVTESEKSQIWAVVTKWHEWHGIEW